MVKHEPSCMRCANYLLGWRSRSPEFPYTDWNIVEKEDIQVGTHAAVDVMQGTAACKGCGRQMTFYCTYGLGYGFTP